MPSNSNANIGTSNDILNPLVEGITLAESIAISLIDTYSEFVLRAPEVIEQCYNVLCNPQNNATEKQVREKVKVE